MKAAIRRTYTSPGQIGIEQIEKPIPKDKEVLIKAHATTVNRTDCANLYVIAGKKTGNVIINIHSKN